MPHFYVAPENISNDTFRITGEDAHYLSSVRRYAVGDRLELFDGTGKSMIGEITSIGKGAISGVLVKTAQSRSPGVSISLYQAVPKGERFDWLVEKAAEIGVASITPLITERSVCREISWQKLDRWRRLSKAACQQCGQSVLMKIEAPVRFLSLELPDGGGASLNLIPWEAENTRTISEAFSGSKSVSSVNILIGPEGGFTVAEVELAGKRGFVPVTLGSRILRSETAGLLSSILILSLAGEYGVPVSKSEF